MTIGVYRIINTATGKVYTGSSKNIEKRWTSHRCDLKADRHYNNALQADAHLYGVQVFSLEILEVTKADDAIMFEREKFWNDEAQKSNECYNPSYALPRNGVGARETCSLCDRAHYAKGYCQFHYDKDRKARKLVGSRD